MTGATARPVSLATRAAFASIAVALLLLGLKIYAAWATGSVAMLGSLADTSLDLIASLVTLFGVRVAAMPADHEHRFGHGKAESLAALVQIGFIVISAAAIAWRAVERLFAGARTEEPVYGIAVSGVAVAATLALLAYQRSVIRRTGSVAIAADHVHYQSDLLLNLAVIAALALDGWAGFAGADPLFGIAIALWLVFGAWRASRVAVDQLMDREWPEERRRLLLEISARHPSNRGTHDLRTPSSNTPNFPQFHIWVDPAMSVAQAHDVVEQIEAALAGDFPGVQLLIHVDPEGQVDEPGNALAETVEIGEEKI